MSCACPVAHLPNAQRPDLDLHRSERSGGGGNRTRVLLASQLAFSERSRSLDLGGGAAIGNSPPPSRLNVLNGPPT